MTRAWRIEFVDHIKSKYLSGAPNVEIPHFKELHVIKNLPTPLDSKQLTG